MARLTLYGIPNCDTVKKARRWLDTRDAAHDFVDYRKNPPTADRVAAWVDAVGSKALRNTSGGAYRELPADKKTWSDARWVEAFAAEPMLIKRPVIERDGVAVQVGFRGTDEELADRLL